MDSNITISGLPVKFRPAHGMVTAVENVNTVFEAGKITGLIGESGSGKSVLGMSLLQLLPNSAVIKGECLYRGNNLLRVRPEMIRSIRGKEIALIPQNPSESLNSVRRIKRQLTEAVTAHDKKKKNEAQQRAQELLQRFGFADPAEIMRRYSFQMSGGMNQRIISVLGLMGNPSWIIADEPTKGLDSILRKQVYQTLRDIAQHDTASMILITHDITLAERLCDNILVLYAGRVLEQGPAAEVLSNPQHPYTKGLIASQPSKGMHPIGGVMPEREGQMAGCNFYPRCRCALDRCAAACPAEYSCDNGSLARCFLYDRS